MKKKAMSLILVLAFALSLCPWALAAEDRETDFFEDQPHTELKFSEIEYKHIEAEPILSAMEEIRGLMADEANEAAVAEKFDAVTGQVMELLTMYTISDIRVYQDVTNEAWVSENEYIHPVFLDVINAFSLLMKDLLQSPCAGFVKAQLTEEDIAYYLSYAALTEEEKALSMEEQALIKEYQTAALQDFTVEYEGQQLNESAITAAYSSGVIDFNTYDALTLEIVKAQNAVLGEIFLRMIPVRNKIAKFAGYDNYGDYAYADIYDRDYTQAEIRAFHTTVKENIAPVSSLFSSLANYQYSDPVFTQDYSGDVALDMIQPYVAQMSSELLEALTYMREHEMYDLAYSETKQSVGFTTMLSTYGAPFMFNQASGSLYDYSTVVHELGHYNNFYWTPSSWNDASNNIDTSEVHSQGLELLFAAHNNGAIFNDSANAVSDYMMANLTYAMVQGCIHDELQQYIYATPDVTLEMINAEYIKLLKAYGLRDMEDPAPAAYGWVLIPHTFESPMYYISYAVSAAGAFAFWLDAQEGDFYEAVDKYLQFVALPAETGFQESFETLGMENPLDPAYVEALAAQLLEKTSAEARLPGLMLSSAFTDIDGSPWYTEAVLALVMGGLMSGYEDGTFRPSAEVNWGMTAKLVLGLMGVEEQPPVEGGTWASGYLAKALELGLIDTEVEQNTAITRAEIAQLLCKALEIPASESASPFADEADGYAVALYEAGVLTGFTAEDGTVTFQGGDSLTRAQLCSILYHVLSLTAEAAPEEVPAA